MSQDTGKQNDAKPNSGEEINPYRHIIRSQQFTRDFLADIFELTEYMKHNEYAVSDELKGKIVALIFYEASTRTRLSFETAALRLGASKIHTESAEHFSSVSKGETLEDTIKTISHYCDYIVLRHRSNSSSEIAVQSSQVPVINAGSGDAHHPTQALLDVYTIHEKFRRLDHLSFTIVGDLLRGRTSNSLIYLLAKYPETHFEFVSPPNSKIKDSLRQYLLKKGVSFNESEDLECALAKSDVVYMTRVQEERFSDSEEFEKARGKFILNAKVLSHFSPNGLILHPFPRVDEITTEVDADPRARYFEQIRNGLYVRMALLKRLNDYCQSSQTALA